MKALVLTEAEFREIVVVDQTAVDTIENAFTWLAQDKASRSKAKEGSCNATSAEPI